LICNDGAFWVIASAPTEDALDWLGEAGRDLGEHDYRHDLD
jgi:hypothetical protein